jgi:hypothetical protein
VSGLTTYRWMAGLFVAALDVAAEAEPRADFFTARSAPRAPEVMIYFSHPLGPVTGTTGLQPTFGLRLQQVQEAGDSGDPAATSDSMRRQQWLSWQANMRSGFHVSTMQLKLGSRLTYDLTSQRFGTPKPGMQLAYPSRSGNTLPNLTPPRRETNGNDANLRAIAAAATKGVTLGKFVPAQPVSNQRAVGRSGH